MVRDQKNSPNLIRAVSRLADAFQALGDVELATARLKEVENIDPNTVSLDLVVLLFRSKLKLAIYVHAKEQNRRPEDIAPMLIEMYVHALGGSRCATDDEKNRMKNLFDLVKKGDEVSARSLLAKQFEFVRGKMLRELTPTAWDTTLTSRRSNCG